jgi:hypothetical protein
MIDRVADVTVASCPIVCNTDDPFIHVQVEGGSTFSMRAAHADIKFNSVTGEPLDVQQMTYAVFSRLCFLWNVQPWGSTQ